MAAIVLDHEQACWVSKGQPSRMLPASLNVLVGLNAADGKSRYLIDRVSRRRLANVISWLGRASRFIFQKHTRDIVASIAR